jgi:hypothetical protein
MPDKRTECFKAALPGTQLPGLHIVSMCASPEQPRCLPTDPLLDTLSSILYGIENMVSPDDYRRNRGPVAIRRNDRQVNLEPPRPCEATGLYSDASVKFPLDIFFLTA